MAQLCINLPDELKQQAEESNLDLSSLLVELVKREIMKQQLLERFNSKEEQEEVLSLDELNKRMQRDRISDEDITELVRKMRDREY